MKSSRMILNVGYNNTLLAMRQAMLERAGYRTASLLWSEKKTAMLPASGEVSLTMLCHSAPVEERRLAAEFLKKRYPDAPLMALAASRFHESMPLADVQTSVEDPDEWLKMVEESMGPRK